MLTACCALRYRCSSWLRSAEPNFADCGMKRPRASYFGAGDWVPRRSSTWAEEMKTLPSLALRVGVVGWVGWGGGGMGGDSAGGVGEGGARGSSREKRGLCASEGE